MGILDDAIREHLDLKRRSGADPNELERLEREALGPVRRSPQEAFEAPVTEESVQDAGDREEVPAEDWSAPLGEPSFPGQGSEPAEVGEIEEWDTPERGPIQAGIPVEPDAAAPATAPPTLPGEAPPPVRLDEQSQYLEQETVEHDVEAEPAERAEQDERAAPAERAEQEERAAPAERAEQEDMLEETPEFLQDTPDHDRLWFEQRPPRDFDFDG